MWVYTPKHGLCPLASAQEAIPCAGVAIVCNIVRHSRGWTIGCGERGRCLWRSAYTPKRGLWLLPLAQDTISGADKATERDVVRH